jgi:hypothetical protein
MAGYSSPRVILGVVLVMSVTGFVLHGFRPGPFWENIFARPRQGMSLRFVFQPAMATIIAVRDGIWDARAGRSPYFWLALFDSEQRSARLHEWTTASGKIFFMGIAIDVAYQIVELKTFYPGEAVLVAILVGFVPYFLLRGPAAQVARRLYSCFPEKSK